MSFVPTTYEEWEHCITVKCDIPLTPAYLAERIEALQNTNDFHTQKFIEQWGQEHLDQTLAWFQQAEAKLNA